MKTSLALLAGLSLLTGTVKGQNTLPAVAAAPSGGYFVQLGDVASPTMPARRLIPAPRSPEPVLRQPATVATGRSQPAQPAETLTPAGLRPILGAGLATPASRPDPVVRQPTIQTVSLPILSAPKNAPATVQPDPATARLSPAPTSPAPASQPTPAQHLPVQPQLQPQTVPARPGPAEPAAATTVPTTMTPTDVQPLESSAQPAAPGTARKSLVESARVGANPQRSRPGRPATGGPVRKARPLAARRSPQGPASHAFFKGLLAPANEQPNEFTQPAIPESDGGEYIELGCDDGCFECPAPCSVWTHTTGARASAVYARFRDADVPYGVPIDGPISSLLTSPIQVGPVGLVDPDYETGFDVGLNVAIGPLTSIAVDYMLIESTTASQMDTEPPNVIRSLVAHPSSTSAAADFLTATAESFMQLQLLDLSLRHLFVGGDSFAVNYSIGARYGRLEQRFDSLFVANGSERVNTEIDFDGAGLRFGLEAERHSCHCRLYGYGRTAASFLAGRFEGTYHQGQTFDPTVVDTAWEAGRVVPVLDFEMGLGWTSKKGRVKISGGYMVSAWFNTVKTQEFIGAVQWNDFNDLNQTLTLDGLAGRVEVCF